MKQEVASVDKESVVSKRGGFANKYIYRVKVERVSIAKASITAYLNFSFIFSPIALFLFELLSFYPAKSRLPFPLGSHPYVPTPHLFLLLARTFTAFLRALYSEVA